MIGLAALLMATFARQGRDGEGRSASVGISPRAVRVEQTRNAQKAEITRLQDELAQARQDLATAIAINASLRSTPMPDRVSTVLQEPPLALILDAPVYEQQHTLSCESSAAAMAANFHGVGISEAAIIAALPRHDNPHLGFRGNIDGPYGGIVDYGVYAEPVRRVLAGWGLEAEHLVGGVNEIRAHIRQGKVVIAWITYNLQMQAPQQVTTSDGKVVTVIPYEHTVLVTGYNRDGLWVNDPYNGTQNFYPEQEFIRSFSYLGNMGLVIGPAVSQ